MEKLNVQIILIELIQYTILFGPLSLMGGIARLIQDILKKEIRLKLRRMNGLKVYFLVVCLYFTLSGLSGFLCFTLTSSFSIQIHYRMFLQVLAGFGCFEVVDIISIKMLKFLKSFNIFKR